MLCLEKMRVTVPSTHHLPLPTPPSQVEFDKPSELLKKENGKFRSLVDESGDRDFLYAMASSSKAPATMTHPSE